MATSKQKLAALKKVAQKFDESKRSRVPSGQPGGGRFASSTTGGLSSVQKIVEKMRKAAATKTKLSVEGLAKKFYDDNLGGRAMKEAAEKAWDENEHLRIAHPDKSAFAFSVKKGVDKIVNDEIEAEQNQKRNAPEIASAPTSKSKTKTEPEPERELVGDERELVGEGAHGAVYRTSKGTVYKEGRIGESETRILGKMGELGISPKLLSQDEGGYEMEFLKGYTPYGSMTSTQGFDTDATGLPEAIAKMHTNGILHNDLHWNNIMCAGEGKSKLIDFGLAEDFDLGKESGDLKMDYRTHANFASEIDRVDQMTRISNSINEHPISKIYRDAAREINDENYLERFFPEDEAAGKAQLEALKKITTGVMEKLKNAA